MGDPVKERLKALDSGGSFRLDLGEQQGTLWLCHARRRNAISADMMLQLEGVLEALEDWQGAVLVVRGEGGHFCAGADLRLMSGVFSGRAGATWMSGWMTDLLNRLRNAPFLSISLLEGAAMGGGAELSTATDFRVMRRNCLYQFVQVRRGVSPGWGGAARLSRTVGRQNALKILTTGDPLEPEQALSLGLVDQIVEDDGGDEALEAFVARFLVHKSHAVRANKLALGNVFGRQEGGPSERECFERCFSEEGLNFKPKNTEKTS